jgi:hypothetical protein
MKPFDFYKEFLNGATIDELAETHQVAVAVVQQNIDFSRKLIPHSSDEKHLIDMIARLMIEQDYLKSIREQIMRGVDESAVQVQKGGEHEKNVVKGKTITKTTKKPVATIASLSKTILDIEKFIAQLLGLLKVEDDSIHKLFAEALKNAPTPPGTHERRFSGTN